MKIKILKDYNELSYTVADIVEEQIKREPLSRFILPTGSTPLSLYKKLVSRDLDWSHVATYNLDEYVDNTIQDQSYRYFLELFFRLSQKKILQPAISFLVHRLVPIVGFHLEYNK